MQTVVDLPTDVLHHIFDLLPNNHLAAISEVCKPWRAVVLARLTQLELSNVRVDYDASYFRLKSLSFARLLAQQRQVPNIWEWASKLDLRRLEELNLSFPACKNRVDIELGKAILARFPVTESIRLLRVANWRLDTDITQHISRVAPSLVTLDLSGCELAMLSKARFEATQLLQAPNLQELVMLNFKVPMHSVLKLLTGFPQLRALAISAGAMLESRHQSYQGLSALTSLTCLALCGARSFGDFDLPVLDGLSLLRSLDLGGTRVTIEGLESYRHLAQLTSLATGSQYMLKHKPDRAAYCMHAPVPSAPSRVLAVLQPIALASILAQPTPHTSLSWHMFGINSAPRLQRLLERIRHLECLSLRGCSLRPGLLHLTRFPALRTLHVDDVDGLSDVWLLLCAKLPNLTELRVCNNRNITARGFATLPSLSRLHCLGVAGCTCFSSACLRYLTGFHHLTELILSFEQTDQMRGLLQLAHLPLEKLTFHPTGSDALTPAQKSAPMFRPVYAANHRRLSEAEIIARLPQHMRVAAARGMVTE